MSVPANSIAARTIARRLCTALVLSALVWLGGLSRAEAGIDVWTTNGPYGGTIRSLAIDPQSSTTLYASVEGVDVNGAPTVEGVFKSTDEGGSWTAINTGLTNPGGISLAIDPQTPTTLYAAGWGGVFKSIDAGNNWTAVNTGLPTPTSVGVLAIDPQTPTSLYVVYRASGGGVFKSTDGGGSWSRTGLTTGNAISALAIDSRTPTTLYAGTWGDGVLKSTDGSATWSAVNTGLTNLTVISLAIDSQTPTTLYAGTAGSGAFKSTDAGGSWTAANSSLPTTILSVEVHPLRRHLSGRRLQEH